ncbi:MAG: ABC transporter permease [bacterium]|nr:ABC transporter permease [bacterium]
MFKDFFRIITDYRTLLYTLAIKELKIKYKSTFLGFLWSIIVPGVMAIVFNIIFSFFFARFTIENMPYTVFLLAGLFPWMYFSSTLTMSTNIYIDQSNVIKKVNIPILILPFSISISNFILLMIDTLVLIAFLLIFRVPLIWQMILIVPVYILFFALTTGFSFLLSSLNVRFRDIKYIVEISLLALFYLTPIIYPVKTIYGVIYAQHKWLFYLLKLNPLFGFITYIQDNIFIGRLIPSYAEIYSFCFALFIFVLGIAVNSAMKKKIMDLV